MVGFRVDTKLFQELGELLVAKESTALVELIKNAYDADATIVNVHGEALQNAAEGRIVVTDNGQGMTAEEFRKGFLTIAGRTKTGSDRRSLTFGRRFTGEKGIGRLAAHKLGTKLQVTSRRAGPSTRRQRTLPDAISALKASIDWSAIEKLETLDDVSSSGAVQVLSARVGADAESGTALAISPLRRKWDERTKNAFLGEAATLAPAEVLWSRLPKGVTSEKLVFDEIPIRDQRTGDPGFQINFTGDLSLSEQLLPDVAQAANWIAEIEFDTDTGVLQMAVMPTMGTVQTFPASEGFRFKKRLEPGDGPSFRARIFQKSGSTWDRAVQGIRVFMEGFRVPPYGDPFDDWLNLDRTYKSRAKRRLISLAELDVRNLPEGMETEELVLQGNAAYMGAVFLHRSSTPGLSMLVSREGFLPGPALDFVSHWTRVATDLIVRLGYAGRKPTKEVRESERASQRDAATRSDVSETPSALRVRESAVQAERSIDVIRKAIARSDFDAAAAEAERAQPHLVEIRSLASDFGSDAVMWRVLASLGTELAAFVHEINSLGLEISGLIRELEQTLDAGLTGEARRHVQSARKRAMGLAGRIKRNATYLVDATSFEGRRRRSRLKLAASVNSVVPFFLSRIERKNIRFENSVDESIRTPLMFPAELSGLLTNLLSNAVKFTDEGGRIRVRARQLQSSLNVTMDNTGVAVDLRTADKWFEAYRSTTEKPDAILGQGMGMGLTIARSFVQEYGGEIAFVKPPSPFATSIEFSIPTQ